MTPSLHRAHQLQELTSKESSGRLTSAQRRHRFYENAIPPFDPLAPRNRVKSMRSGVNDPTEQVFQTGTLALDIVSHVTVREQLNQAVLGKDVMGFKERRALLLNQKQADEAPSPSTTAKHECNLTPGDMTTRAAQLQAALNTSPRAAGAAGAADAAETETHV